MSETISPGLAKLFIQAKRNHTDLYFEHQALLHVLKNSIPYFPPEVRAEFMKYHEIKDRLLQEHLLRVENSDPAFASQLDIETPLIPKVPRAGGK